LDAAAGSARVEEPGGGASSRCQPSPRTTPRSSAASTARRARSRAAARRRARGRSGVADRPSIRSTCRGWIGSLPSCSLRDVATTPRVNPSTQPPPSPADTPSLHAPLVAKARGRCPNRGLAPRCGSRPRVIAGSARITTFSSSVGHGRRAPASEQWCGFGARGPCWLHLRLVGYRLAW
jgi:hypothetical protein